MLKIKSKKLISLILIILILTISSISMATNEAIMPISEGSEQTNEAENLGENSTSNGQGTDQSQTIDTSNWINEDVYLCSNDIEIDRIVDGNAFAIGNTVTVKGEIGGDLYVIANKLVIDEAYVYNSVYALANEIEINGIVYDLYACASKITIGQNGYVYRDLRATTNTLSIYGLIRRNVYATVNKIEFAEDENNLINGNLNYESSQEIEIPEGVVVGEVNYTKVLSEPTQSLQSVILSYVGDLARALIYGLVIILATLWLAPKFNEKLSNVSGKKTAISFGIGLLACIVVPFVSLLLLVSVLGMSVSLAIIVLLALIVSMSKAVVAMAVSGMITKKFNLQGKVKYVLIALVAVGFIWAIGEIPFGIGLILKALIGFIGVGLVITNIINKKQKKIEEVSEEK